MAGKVRVLFAGNIYAKLALVRRFLEDDGYEVVGVARTKQDVIRAVQEGRPDAVVVDEEWVDRSLVGTILRIRAAQPGAKIVVFTAGPPIEETAPKGADGYLEKGAPVAALTSMLGRLFADTTVPIDATTTDQGTDAEPAITAPVDVVVIPDAEEATAPAEADGSLEPARFASVDDMDDEPSDERRFGGVRLAALVTGIVLIVWSLASIIDRNDGEHPSTVAAGPSPSTVLTPPQSDELQTAYDTLDSMVAALRGANYVLATVDAQQLMQQLETAQAAGFQLGALDDEITSRLGALARTLPARVITQLQDTMGSLFPQITTEPGGGSTLMPGTFTNPGSGGTLSGGGSTGGGGPTVVGGSTGGGGSIGGGGSGGAGDTPPGPGDGKAWGQSHKPPHGGWHGEKPKHDKKPKHHGKP